MAKGTLSNLQELEVHITQKFKGMMKSKEMAEAGKRAGQAIGRHIGDIATGKGNDSGYDYNQSGAFHKQIMEEGKFPDLKQTPTKLTVGVFELNNMNLGVDARRNHQVQIHEVWDNKSRAIVRKPISLKAESQMPKWILAEFGSGKFANAVPPQFKITYTKREDKKYLFGPSIGPVRGIGGGSKNGYFKVSNDTLVDLLGDNRARQLDSHREHKGIRAGHVFSRGFNNSKTEVQEILGQGIERYLNNK